jgi:CubicO group peptidase (beta-lactamase class C family)
MANRLVAFHRSARACTTDWNRLSRRHVCGAIDLLHIPAQAAQRDPSMQVAYLSVVLCAGVLWDRDDLTQSLQGALDQIRHDQMEANRQLPDEQKNLIPGITAAIVFKDGREIQLWSGFSDVKNKMPMLPGMRMPGGSTGKMFAGALATLLVNDGELKLSQKITRYCKDAGWFVHLPNNRSIRLRHLLNHSSGLGSYFANPEFLSLVDSKGSIR